MIALPRRAALALAAAVAAPALAGCSTGSTEVQDTSRADTRAQTDAFPVTIEHAFGKTTIEEEPQRVATVGYADQDAVLALGVVPVGATKIVWGGTEDGSTPWFDDRLEELGGEQPVRYDESDGAPADEIAKVQPDLILGTYSGMTEQEYSRLSKIAPVVPYPEEAWATPWQTSLEMVGQALGRTDEAEQVEAEVADQLSETTADHPELEGTSFVLGGIAATDLSKIDYVTPLDVRSQTLEDFGLVNSPAVEQLSKDTSSFYGSISAERASSLRSDIFIAMFYDFAEADASVLTEDPLLSKIPGVEDGGLVVGTDPHATQSLSTPTVLSLPYAMEHFMPKVAEAAARAKG
jgi:iron complex transport system substrate-binding protein